MKLAGGIAVAFYVLGFICINAYLLTLGASDFSLARPRFMSTGIFCASVLAVSLWPGTGIRTYKGEPIDWLPRLLLFLAQAFFAAFILVSMLMIVPGGRVQPGDAWASALNLLGTAVAIRFLMSCFAQVSRRTFGAGDTTQGRYVMLGFIGLFGFMTLLSGFLLFIHPKVSAQFGGGMPRPVVLLLDKDTAPHFLGIGLPLCPDGVITQQVRLMYESDTQYVIESASRILVMDKAATIAIATRNLPACSPK